MNQLRIHSRTFSAEDQAAFAKLSGDYNDLHLDVLAARRSQFGSPLVHGVNVLLWALDCCLQAHNVKFEFDTLRVLFTREVKVGEPIHIKFVKDEPTVKKLKVFTAETAVATVWITLRNIGTLTNHWPTDGFPEKSSPRDIPEATLASQQGELKLYLDVATLNHMYPNLAACLDHIQIAVILSATRLVGIYCPGKYSLFSELQLASSANSDIRSLEYKVVSVDNRFGLVGMNIRAPSMTGMVQAFHRRAPQRQASYKDFLNIVTSGEFARQRALVVGGSRGLGEVVAKLLCAGGADVKITYHQGQSEANDLVREIVASGGILGCFKYDVLKSTMSETDVSLSHWFPTHLYYFATPAIFSAVGGKFSTPLFQNFCRYYVSGLLDTLNALEVPKIRQVFCPSSIAVSDPPLNMGEYAAAKVACETLGVFLQKAYKEMIIYQPRLPRLATDQTANVAAVENGDPIPVMLAELRAFQTMCE